MSDSPSKQEVRDFILPPLHLRPRSKEEDIYIAKKGITYFVPDTSGLERPAAVAHIQGAGLTVGKVSSRYNDAIPRGRVISTLPPPNFEVQEGAQVSIILSYGPKDPPSVITSAPSANPFNLVTPDPTMPVQYDMPVPESE
jgi:hypothetical protein